MQNNRGVRGSRESAVCAIIVRNADPKLHAVKTNERLTLWEFDAQLNVNQVA